MIQRLKGLANIGFAGIGALISWFRGENFIENMQNAIKAGLIFDQMISPLLVEMERNENIIAWNKQRLLMYKEVN